MHYLLTPLHVHYDSGFGATGDAFYTAAEQLEEEIGERRGTFNQALPINYLRRHAIELYLKSTIVIIHRRLNLPFGHELPECEPHALVRGKWVPFYKLHSVADLWGYLRTLFANHKEFFETLKTLDLVLPDQLDHWIETVEKCDPRSTFFRYPTLGDPSADELKAVMKEDQPEAIFQRMNERPEEKQFVLLMKNDEGEVTRGYYFEDTALKEFGLTLKECAYWFFCLHAAFRSVLCGGA